MSIAKHSCEDGYLKIVFGVDVSASDFAKVAELIEERGNVVKVGLDMRNCSCVQSKMLAELIALKKKSANANYETVLLNVGESVFQLLDMSGLSSLFVIEDDFSSYGVGELCEKLSDPSAALEISDYMAANYNDDIRRALIDIIDSGDPVRSGYAVLTMGRAQDYASADIFRDSLGSSLKEVRAAAVLVLGWTGDTGSKNAIYDLMRDGDPEVAEAAAASIALLSDDTDSAKLRKYLDDSSPRVRRCAAQALALINDETGFCAVRDRLPFENDESVKVAFARAVSSFNRDEVATVLIKLLDDASLRVREAAASGLVKAGPKNYAGKLLDKVTDGDSWVGFFAAKSLAGACDAEVTAKLIEVYPGLDQNVKLAVIEALGKSGAAGESFLIARTGDDNEDIRKEALSALQNSGSPAALDKALEFFDSDESWLVRYKAVEIILASKPEGYAKLLMDRIAGEDNRYVKEKLLSRAGE